MYRVEPFKIKPGMLVADSPWSGHYAVREALWAYALPASLARSAGSTFPRRADGSAGGGTYVTLKSPQTDYSVILETGGAEGPPDSDLRSWPAAYRPAGCCVVA